MNYLIRPAGLADVPALMALRTEAEGWLASAGTDQWSDPETGGRALAKWHDSINEGRAWVLLDTDGTTVGTVSRGPADRDFWREDDKPESAFYLYKLITSRSVSGQGLGSLVLDWACRVAALEGREWVRIDCWRTNTGLQRYYERLGFKHVRTESPAHRKSGWLAQRPSNYLVEADRSLATGRFVINDNDPSGI
ncbi:GNAT family N-acetyltransferase [Streptomyces sp. NPDC053720]|uniref:GNAT family N-acetyltransferase n=1 Tax=Streptomyces sp. NPDC053720 TaxID=3154855 RepID=UPI0034146340